ncbi:hypothetical protein INR49_003837 [Caranx melampygus]|nr:hypothetical protein INR49_003837 [Caranx melampygus]
MGQHFGCVLKHFLEMLKERLKRKYTLNMIPTRATLQTHEDHVGEVLLQPLEVLSGKSGSSTSSEKQPGLTVCMPMRIHTGMPGRCLSSKLPMNAKMSSAMQQISTACLFPFLLGSPEATM